MTVYDGSWSEPVEVTDFSVRPALDDPLYRRIWTNHDILDTTSSVWLKADSVTPIVPGFPKWANSYAFQAGMMLGYCSKPIPIVESIAGGAGSEGNVTSIDDHRAALVQGYLAGIALRDISMKPVIADVIFENGCLYIKDADVTLIDNTLEVE